MNDFFEARNKKLMRDLQTAALNVLDHNRTEALCMPIDGTDPVLYVFVGDAAALARLSAIIDSGGGPMNFS
ncbi:hypothetical protein LXA47_20115 [Massilia sp. P8910]|uniref:Uncharacterized protein n=1 Tax=Massilia antarctica TaxID=2765360 RepID=A0AA48WFQ5_9BURK|nr:MULTISPECIES: hypothetical protein [Massilia]CUI09770.1 hypothetical protein BN2497_14317 [Janthinobacterium sp. CG23_2]MCE3605891.1 hypothetical protein [Massilia antarctica]MCY0910975.1 hypothetical protein [Massilia sp. H27-R4]QPI50574.1 hypothetical protein IV454_02855 [Massilia antarctica]CUU33556.1 hypothetical protein BN3177_14317 [Janthinobacterium sp. CG23_2]